MGNYNSQYENYYKSIINKRSNSKNYFEKYSEKRSKGNPVTRRIIQDLCGVLVMLIIVIICKIIQIPQTQIIYNYSKQVVNTNLDYKGIVSKVKALDEDESVQDKAVEIIDKIKTKFTGGETIKEKIREKFTLPAEGIIKEEEEGINIGTSEKGEISASYDGRVKECGEDTNLGNYIIIDHGEGIETLYSNLDKVLVKENDIVKKGDSIAENKNNDIKNVHFEILFMGQNKGLEKMVRAEK
ncbi:M23 family metallopeptidase [Clostridium sp.]|jgi:hypothetical protein|uniref:M23 family metallopeptidase n=1 Tax=Clostridium sp. TaxID=1506 RepID=UPI0039F4BF5E